MESLTFTDKETKYYGDLFTHLDSEGSGVIPVNQVHEFLRASKLSPEVLTQVGWGVVWEQSIRKRLNG